MKTVYKFPVPIIGETFTINNMPAGAQILTVAMQRGSAQIWALCETDAEQEPRTFIAVGTGHEIPYDDGATTYLGTFQTMGGALEFHLFEVSV